MMTSLFQKLTNTVSNTAGGGVKKDSTTNVAPQQQQQKNEAQKSQSVRSVVNELEAIFLEDEECNRRYQGQEDEKDDKKTLKSINSKINGTSASSSSSSNGSAALGNTTTVSNTNPSLNSNSNSSGYATSGSGRSTPQPPLAIEVNENATKSSIELVDNSTIGNNNVVPKNNLQQLNNQFDLINSFFSLNNHSNSQAKNSTINSNQPNTSPDLVNCPLTDSIFNAFGEINTSFSQPQTLQQSNNEHTASNSETSGQTQVTFNLNSKPADDNHKSNSNNQNQFVYTANDFLKNNLVMRRERSLDRCTMTDSHFDPPHTLASHRSYYMNNSSTQPSTPQHQNFPAYVNSTLYLSGVTPKQSIRQHHRSNSILASNLITSSTTQSAFNPLTFSRDNAMNGGATSSTNPSLNVGIGFRSSARDLSSSNFANISFMARETSANSVNLPNESVSNQASTSAHNNSQSVSSSKLSFIKDLQIRLMDMQKECYYLRCELDACQQKLASNMQSIKQFWSPELKKERQMRKEEANKYQLLVEQFKILQAQYQTLLESYEQQSLTTQQLNAKVQQLQIQDDIIGTSSKNLIKEKSLLKKTINELEMRITAQKQSLATKDETIKKLFQLVKTLSSKQVIMNQINQAQGGDLSSLNNNLENIAPPNEIDSIKSQLESNLNPTSMLLNDPNVLKERLLDEERKNLQLQQYIFQIKQQNLQQISQLGNMTNDSFLTMETLGVSGEAHSNMLLMEANSFQKDASGNNSQMKQLEVHVQQLQGESNETRPSLNNPGPDLPTANNQTSSMVNSAIQSTHVSPHANIGSLNSHLSASASNLNTQIELLKTNEKFLKEKVETLKFELSRKETELQQIKTKNETFESKEKDLQHYLTLLKESISTKDQQITMQQSEITELRTRLREKETFIEKKNQQLANIQLERHQRDSDIGELRDQMDIKERKISVLNRKIDNLEEQLKDKEIQIGTLRAKLNSSSSSSSVYNSNVMHNLEQTLEQKERLIEKLSKDAMNRSQTQSREIELTEQIDTLNISIKELNEKIELKNKEIQDYQNEIFYLKDELESLKTQLLRKDSHVNSLELSLTQKNEEIEMIEDKLQKATKQLQQQHHLSTNTQSQQQRSSSNSNLNEVEALKAKIVTLQKELNTKDIQTQQLETELVTLKELIDDFEEQKQVLKYKLEQHQIQFSQLERQFEQTTQDYEKQLKEQQKQFEDRIAVDSKRFSVQRETKWVQTQNDYVREGSPSLSKEERDKYEAELEDQLNIIKNLQDQLEIERIELAEREELIGKLTTKVKELENALRESVSITAEREIVFAQQKKKSDKLEEENKNIQEEIISMQKSLNENKLMFNRYQEELYQREELLQKLEEEKVKEMNELLITKQEILLSTISEKDAIIGELECDKNSSSSKARIQRLYEEKDNLHQQLKDLNEKRMKLMNDYMHAKEAKDQVKAFSINQSLAHDVDGIYA